MPVFSLTSSLAPITNLCGGARASRCAGIRIACLVSWKRLWFLVVKAHFEGRRTGAEGSTSSLELPPSCFGGNPRPASQSSSLSCCCRRPSVDDHHHRASAYSRSSQRHRQEKRSMILVPVLRYDPILSAGIMKEEARGTPVSAAIEDRETASPWVLCRAHNNPGQAKALAEYDNPNPMISMEKVTLIRHPPQS